MGVTQYSWISPFSFTMGVLWFNAFILLSIFMRKMRFPIKCSSAPLLVLLFSSLFRILFPLDFFSCSQILHSKVVLPRIISVLEFKVVPYQLFSVPVNVRNLLLFSWLFVTAVLLARFVIRNIRFYKALMSQCVFRDMEAEMLLAEIAAPADPRRRVRVYRIRALKVPMVTGLGVLRVFLPEMAFSRKELRGLLAHEWKHYKDKDAVVGVIVSVICCVFWWNPCVYLLRRNVYLAQELKSDYAAVSAMDGDLKKYLQSLFRIAESLDEEPVPSVPTVANALTGPDGDLYDRFLILQLSQKSRQPRRRRKTATWAFYVAMAALFVFSYVFVVQPFTSTAPDIVPAEDYWREKPLKAGENFILENADGTYCIYLDGRHAADATGIVGHAYVPRRKGGDACPLVQP